MISCFISHLFPPAWLHSTLRSTLFVLAWRLLGLQGACWNEGKIGPTFPIPKTDIIFISFQLSNSIFTFVLHGYIFYYHPPLTHDCVVKFMISGIEKVFFTIRLIVQYNFP